MQYHTVSSLHVYLKENSVIFIFSSIGGHSEQESTLNQLLVEMDGELNKVYTFESVYKRNRQYYCVHLQIHQVQQFNPLFIPLILITY